MRLTRRGLFATVAAAIAARFLPKPKCNSVCWREDGHTFYRFNFDPLESKAYSSWSGGITIRQEMSRAEFQRRYPDLSLVRRVENICVDGGVTEWPA